MAGLTDRRRQRAPPQPGVSEALGPPREGIGRPAPPQLVHILEEADARPKRREVLEAKRQIARIAQKRGGWKVLDGSALALAGFTLLATILFPTEFDRSEELYLFGKDLAIAGGLLALAARP